MNTEKIKKLNVKMVAHRGVSGLERENTAAAFVAAGNRSYYGIETDVHVTADKKYIIIHDDDTERVAGVKLGVEESNYEDLRKIRLKDLDGNDRADLCFPSLEEYLDICKKYEKVCVLELKNPMAAEDIKGIYETVVKTYEVKRVIFISFSYENLVELRKLDKTATLQFLTGDQVTDDLIKKIKKYDMDLDIYYERLNKENILFLHSSGVKVNCWTVNDFSYGEKLATWDVDFITSNILE
ncbi:MAG: hypothetical protein HP008_02200 [Clostridia bacterium]|nr:hypothetical protein [Clostridia bacterium]